MVIVMNNKYPLVLTIHNMDDIELLKHNSTTEYINIDLDYPNKEIINYFKNTIMLISLIPKMVISM